MARRTERLDGLHDEIERLLGKLRPLERKECPRARSSIVAIIVRILHRHPVVHVLLLGGLGLLPVLGHDAARGDEGAERREDAFASREDRHRDRTAEPRQDADPKADHRPRDHEHELLELQGGRQTQDEVIKHGAGRLLYLGATTNTYTGTTNVENDLIVA